MEKILFTSESVTEGHPDKMCDAISDAILDALMEKDPMSRVACETATTTGLVLVMGEITTNAYIDIQKIVRDTIKEIGYTRGKYGFDAETCGVITAIDEQSADIALGVDKALEAKMGEDEIDAIGMCRGSRDDVAEMSRVTIALMQELDRLPNDVILIGTTNRVDNLDEALIRRFTFKHRVKPLGDDDMKELCKKFLASADYPFTESELDELCHSLREQRTASAVVNACTERIVAHIVSQLPENSADAV